MAKPFKEIKIKETKGGKITAAVEAQMRNLLRSLEYYDPVLAVWNQATDAQRQKYLDNSPLLSELLEWSNRWQR